MNSLDRALKWARLGFQVIPCYAQDIWDGSYLRRAKSPMLGNGVSGASSDEMVIKKWFSDYPDAIAGVKVGDDFDLADIDIELDSGLDGAFELSERSLELPDSDYAVQTRRGGWHYLYRRQPGKTLGPMAPIKDVAGNDIPGVDRRSGNSYFIAWSDDIPEDLTGIPFSPDWLSIGGGNTTLSQYSKGLSQWLNDIPVGNPTEKVLEVAMSIPAGEFGHTQMISIQRKLVGLATEGHTGVANALFDLQEAWLFGVFNTQENLRDWVGALEGAVAKYGQLQSDPEHLNSRYEQEVEALVHRKMVEIEAEARVSAKYFSGSEILSWDALQARNQDFIVADLLPAGGIVFLVARSNLGKTVAYVDMVCRMIFGMPWIGKTTRFARVIIVATEGLSGMYSRFATWCEAHDCDFETVKQNVLLVDGANLNSSVSLARLSDAAQEFQADLMIFDTFSNVSGVADEDKAALNALTLSNAEAIKPGMTKLFVHHPRKSDQNTSNPEMRGSSVLKGRADVVITLFHESMGDTKNPCGGSWISLSTEAHHGGKNRDSATETIKGLYLDAAFGASPVLRWNKDKFDSRSTTAVKKHLEGKMTVREFASASEVSEKTADRYLKAAVADGVVEKINSNASNKPNYYQLCK